MESIVQRLDYWANRHPRKLLYSFLNLSGEATESYSYDEFLHRTNVIAGHLRREFKFAANDRLLLAFPPGLEMICAFFGCVRAGVIPVPVYPSSPHGRHAAFYKMDLIARDCGASGVLTDRRMSSPDAGYLSDLRWIVSEDLKAPATGEIFGDGGEVLFLQYTSGSTSSPKGVMVRHANVLHNGSLLVDRSSAVGVSWLPQYHDMGLIGYYLNAALSGGTTYGFSPMSFIQRPALWLDTITRYRATHSSAPNFAFEYCLRPGRLPDETLAQTDLSSLRSLMTAAEPVKPGTYQRFLETFQPYGLRPEHFFAAYGLAENTLAVTSHGRNVLSVSKKALALGRVRITSEVSEIAAARQIVSCGAPLGDIGVKIVDPEKHIAVEDGTIGEIWTTGRSTCAGYWNNPDLTQKTFRARIVGDTQRRQYYLRTGDVGFLHDGELYVCGRIKDMIIVRGQNYYPQDIENIVEDVSDLIRKSCVAAFEIDENGTPAMAVVAEVKSRRAIPDPLDLIAAIRTYANLDPASITIVAARSLPKTSSGKIMRHMAKRMWLENRFEVLTSFTREADADRPDFGQGGVPAFHALKARYNFTGEEPQSLIELGVDSLDLVLFLHEVTELLKEHGAATLAGRIDIALIQQISVADLFRLADLFQRSPDAAVLHVEHSLAHVREDRRNTEKEMMFSDARLTFQPRASIESARKRGGAILLTGGTGFVGPFLLKSLLEQTDCPIYVLVRARDEIRGRERLEAALASIAPWTPNFRKMIDQRVFPVCGNLGLPNLGLSEERWALLARQVHTIYHNGASVNYLFTYEAMRAANVLGTNEIVRLAFDQRQKALNYVSTTFIFGWAVKEILYETDANRDMEALDFGYSQTKWVAEQIVMDAARHGLITRIFRPALVSPSVGGGGTNLDIAIRLLAFMINHGIGVDTLNQVSFVPADIVANNIVAISNAPDTIGSTYHVTRDQYSSMIDITSTITRLTGRRFELFKLADFVPEVIRRSTKDDLLFPLLDFLKGSVDSIASMEIKRYDSSSYQKARAACPAAMRDPSLEDTVSGILRFMRTEGIISLQTPLLGDSVRNPRAAGMPGALRVL